MKKNTLFIGLVIMLINLNVIGQEKGTKFGIKAGINYSNFIFGKDIPSEFPANFNGKIGFHFGGFLILKLSNDLMLKSELLFSTHGAEYELNMTSFALESNDDLFFGNNYKVDIKESLILLPIMLDYYFNQSFDIEFGPQLGYVISKDISDNNENFDSVYQNYDKFEIGLNLGLGYSFAKNYRLGIRYNYGIMERNNQKSSVFQLGLQYEI